jgi:hypothetical protein
VTASCFAPWVYICVCPLSDALTERFWNSGTDISTGTRAAYSWYLKGPVLSLLSLFWKKKNELMRAPVCLSFLICEAFEAYNITLLSMSVCLFISIIFFFFRILRVVMLMRSPCSLAACVAPCFY